MRKFLDEWDYLIHLVRCAIHNEQPQELPDTFDFEKVYEYGMYHHVANIAFYSVEKLRKQPEKPLYAKWEMCRDQAVIRDINQSFAAEEIRNVFQSAGIRWLEVQGTRIKPLYPQPEYRAMSDIDFIVDLENLSRASALLESLGYQCQNIYGVEINAFRSPNINVELHTDYFLDIVDYHSVMRSPFASIEKTGEYDINEFYLYNILHTAKHYLSGGCGIRRVLDAYYLNKNYGYMIDREYVGSVLKRANAVDFAAELAALAEGWFGADEQNVSRGEMASYIIWSGLHGNCRNELKNRLERNLDNTTRLAKLKYFLRRILGTWDIMRKTYPVLERHKLLYPFCWLHRAFCALLPEKRKQLSREVKAVMDKTSQ